MEIKLQGTSEEQRLLLIGELIAETCGSFREMVMEVAGKQPKEIILDLHDVAFIDTSGLGVLVGLRTHLKSKGIKLSLTNPNEKVLQNFKMTRLDTVFGIDS